MGDVRELSENSPVQMQQVIGELLTGKSASSVALSLGIPATRITRWYRESDAFAELLAETEQVAIDQIRSALVEEQTRLVMDLMPKARERLAEALDSDKENIRLAASQAVFRLVGGNSRTSTRPDSAPAPVEAVVRTLDARPAAGD